MQSFIIASKDKKEAQVKSGTLCQEKDIAQVDISFFGVDEPLGIKEIRNLHKTLFLTPVKSKTKAVILDQAEKLTVEAQNALLKVLEEPPAHVIIILLAENVGSLLPTIISRCKVILLDSQTVLSEEESKEYKDMLARLQSAAISERLKIAQDVTKNKEEVLFWLEKMILASRESLIEKIANGEKVDLSSFIFHLSSFQKTYTLAKTTNANQRLLVENLFLNL